MIRLFAISIILGLMSGCMHTYYMDKSKETGYQVVNRKAKHQQAIILLTDGRKIQAKKLSMYSDSTTWVSSITGEIERIATNRILSVTIRNHGKGALEGLGLGILGGAFIGILTGAAIPTKNSESPFNDWYPPIPIMAGLLGAGGGVLGLLIGGASGSKEVYSFDLYTIPEADRH